MNYNSSRPVLLIYLLCRDVQGSHHAGAQPKPLGVSNGFVVPPLRLMHCDTLEVFANRPGALVSPDERRQAEGVGLLLRTAVFAHGHACGCTKAEILAINDDGELSLSRKPCPGGPLADGPSNRLSPCMR